MKKHLFLFLMIAMVLFVSCNPNSEEAVPATEAQKKLASEIFSATTYAMKGNTEGVSFSGTDFSKGSVEVTFKDVNYTILGKKYVLNGKMSVNEKLNNEVITSVRYDVSVRFADGKTHTLKTDMSIPIDKPMDKVSIILDGKRIMIS